MSAGSGRLAQPRARALVSWAALLGRHEPCRPSLRPRRAADLLESRYFQQEAGLPHRLFLLWMVGLAARCKY